MANRKLKKGDIVRVTKWWPFENRRGEDMLEGKEPVWVELACRCVAGRKIFWDVKELVGSGLDLKLEEGVDEYEAFSPENLPDEFYTALAQQALLKNI